MSLSTDSISLCHMLSSYELKLITRLLEGVDAARGYHSFVLPCGTSRLLKRRGRVFAVQSNGPVGAWRFLRVRDKWRPPLITQYIRTP